jgi:hypothetical chaperone protein
MSDPENGFYIKSPKSFLGANISDAQQAVFSTVVEKNVGLHQARN